MNYRPLGKTGIRVSEIGFGAWGIGGAMWKGSEDAESLKSLHRAVDLGVNFIDTALAYGDGHSEELVGQLVREREETIYVATKIPPKNQLWPAQAGTSYRDVFPASYIIECTERSLKNLGMERIDLQQFHVWIDEWSGVDEIWTAIQRLKSAGKIRSFGISINDHQPASALKAANSGMVDAFQVIYNIFDQSPEDELLPLCQKLQIGILARVPFDEGSLTGAITPTTEFLPDDWRNWYFQGNRKQQVYEHVQQLKPLLGAEASTLPELALRFILAHPAVTTVIPGMRKIRNVEQNTAVSDGRALTSLLLEKVKKHRWIRNFYRDEKD